QGGVVDPFGHFRSVQPDAEEPRARNRVAADGIRGPLARVIADEHGGAERVVDALHHLERPRKAAHDADVLRYLVDEQALPVAVRIADDDLGGTGVADAGDGCVHLAGHPLACSLVLEAVRAELCRLDGTGDALHVDRDEDLARAPLCMRHRCRQEEGPGRPGKHARAFSRRCNGEPAVFVEGSLSCGRRALAPARAGAVWPRHVWSRSRARSALFRTPPQRYLPSPPAAGTTRWQ